MDSVAVKVCAILLGAAVLTAWQLPAWSSDVALWEQAVAENRRAPRPPYNLGVAHQREGRLADAASWYHEAIRRAELEGTAGRYRAMVDAQLAAMELQGFFACDTDPSVWPLLCSS